MYLVDNGRTEQIDVEKFVPEVFQRDVPQLALKFCIERLDPVRHLLDVCCAFFAAGAAPCTMA